MLAKIIKRILPGRTEIEAHYTKPTEEEEAAKLYAEFKDFNSFGTLSLNGKIFHMYIGEVEKVQIIENVPTFKHKIILIEM